MEFHEAANIFPLDEEHIGELAKDIRENGLLVPIETLDGKIIDGRRRFMACKKAGTQPKFRAVETTDPVAYVVSLNLHRRHLTTGQAAMCATRAEALSAKLKAEANERMKRGKADPKDNCPEGGQTRDKLGAMFGVSGKAVERAGKVRKEGIPALVKAVDAGKISVNKAQYISTHEPELQGELLQAELSQEQKTQHKAKPQESNGKPDPDTNPEDRHSRGKGITLANQAINLLQRIPKRDALRKRGFQIVLEFVQRSLRKM